LARWTSKCEHRANPVLQKNNAEPRQEQSAPRDHSDASSTFAGAYQFYVNAIASVPYNRLRPHTYRGHSVEDRNVFGVEYFLTDRRIGGPEIQKEHIA
jgi:hypothetical protein